MCKIRRITKKQVPFANRVHLNDTVLDEVKEFKDLGILIDDGLSRTWPLPRLRECLFLSFLYYFFFLVNMQLNCNSNVRPTGIRDDHKNPQISSLAFSPKYFSLWQLKKIVNFLNSCSVNYFIPVLTLCMLMDSLKFTIFGTYEKVPPASHSSWIIFSFQY